MGPPSLSAKTLISNDTDFRVIYKIAITRHPPLLTLFN